MLRFAIASLAAFGALSSLPCLASASASGSEGPRYLPALFEDFEGTSSLRVAAVPARNGPVARIKATVLIPPEDLDSAGFTLTRLGIRADGRHPARMHELKGVITLETTSPRRLSRRLGDNHGDAPIAFFVTSRLVSAPASCSCGPFYVFDLPGGYLLPAAQDSSLLVHLELTGDEAFSLDLAPAQVPELVYAFDLNAEAGTVSPGLPILALWRQPALDPPAPPVCAVDPRRSEQSAEVAALTRRVVELQSSLLRLEASTQSPRPQLVPAGQANAKFWVDPLWPPHVGGEQLAPGGTLPFAAQKAAKPMRRRELGPDPDAGAGKGE